MVTFPHEAYGPRLCPSRRTASVQFAFGRSVREASTAIDATAGRRYDTTGASSCVDRRPRTVAAHRKPPPTPEHG